MEKIKVSIICISYNHENYIRQALDGFILQKTNFAYEVIVNDDASTDNTQEIIRDYSKKYPGIIIPILREQNCYAKVTWHQKLNGLCRGEYIAICEGDDYWTDPYKLQKQVDILDIHKECSGCGGNVTVVDYDGTPHTSPFLKQYLVRENDEIMNFRQIYLQGRFAQTCSLMYRKQVISNLSGKILEEYKNIKMTGDMKLAALIAASGDFYQLSDFVGCYRYITTHGDSWSASIENRNITGYLYNGFCEIEQFMQKYFGIEKLYSLHKAMQLKDSINKYMDDSSYMNQAILLKILAKEDF